MSHVCCVDKTHFFARKKHEKLQKWKLKTPTTIRDPPTPAPNILRLGSLPALPSPLHHPWSIPILYILVHEATFISPIEHQIIPRKQRSKPKWCLCKLLQNDVILTSIVMIKTRMTLLVTLSPVNLKGKWSSLEMRETGGHASTLGAMAGHWEPSSADTTKQNKRQPFQNPSPYREPRIESGRVQVERYCLII